MVKGVHVCLLEETEESEWVVASEGVFEKGEEGGVRRRKGGVSGEGG